MPSKPPAQHHVGYRTTQQRNQAHDQRRTQDQPWRAWYWTQRWRNIAKAQLTREPLCAICLAQGNVTPASVADHVQRHEGNPDLFWRGDLQSLCAHHHNSDKQREERGAGQKSKAGRFRTGAPTKKSHMQIETRKSDKLP